MTTLSASSNLRFNEVTHTYFYNDKEVKSVTWIITNGLHLDTQWFDDNGRDRGKAVHEACLLHLQRRLDYTSIHPVIEPYFLAFKKFIGDSGAVPILKYCEEPQINTELMYCGTPDLLMRMNRQFWLIDIKTGSASNADPQLAAYYELPKIKIFEPRRAKLFLSKKGYYRLEEFKGSAGWISFLKAYTECKKLGLLSIIS